jgi:serine/threonine protein phosphatase PrpC
MSSNLSNFYPKKNSMTENDKRNPTSPLKFKAKRKNRMASLSIEEKMQVNFRKALKEHKKNEMEIEKFSYSLDKQQIKPLSFHYQEKASIGMREEMEDAHFFIEIEEGALAAVFDGHGDNGLIANLAAERVKRNFSAKLKELRDVKLTFEQSIADIHREVWEKDMDGGCTALICFIDKASNKIYTATLGDSEAKIFRKTERGIESIPLSCVRDWASKKDETRALEFFKKMGLLDIAHSFLNAPTPKERRFPFGSAGINVSRSIGDKQWAAADGTSAVSIRPKVTLYQIEPQDLLILACDGIWDFCSDQGLISTVLAPNWDKELADFAALINAYALEDCGSMDNVTVLAIRVTEQKS